MLTASFVAPFTYEALDALKLAVLYFDRVELMRHRLYQLEKIDEAEMPGLNQNDIRWAVGRSGTAHVTDGFVVWKEFDPAARYEVQGPMLVRGVTDFTDEEFESHVAPLVRAGVLDLHPNRIHYYKAGENAERFLGYNLDLLFEREITERDADGRPRAAILQFADPEIATVHEKYRGDLTSEAPLDLTFLYEYYAALLADVLAAGAHGQPCFSNSPVLSECLQRVWQMSSTAEHDAAPNVAQQALAQSLPDILQVAVPDTTGLSFEDVLSLRSEAIAELMAFRFELEDLASELAQGQDAQQAAQVAERISGRAKKAVGDLTARMRASKLRALKRLADKLSDVRSYIPFAGALYADIPGHVAALLALGVISLPTAIEHMVELQEIRQNGFFYLLKLRSLTGS